MTWNKLISVLLVILLYKLFVNVFSYFKCNYYYSKYLEWLQGKNNGIDQDRIVVISLFKRAGIKNAIIPHVRPLGYFQLSYGNASHFENALSLDQECVALTYRAFNNSLGVYKSRIFETFSPFYWINTLIYLPSTLIAYLGGNINSVLQNSLMLFIGYHL